MTFEDALWLQTGPTYSAREDRIILDSLWDEGVVDMTCMAVLQHGAGDYTVDIGVGSAVITGDDQAPAGTQGKYLVKCTAAENKVVAAAPGANSRYDLVVCEVNDSNATNARVPADVAEFRIVTGTADPAPSVPALPVTAIPIAVIGPILSTTPSILQSLIWDITNWSSAPAAAQAMAAQCRRKRGARSAPATIEWSASQWAPSGWLPCAGQSLLRADYPALFAEIGTQYGNVDGTHFNVPDLRGRAAVALDNLGGSDAGRLTVANTLGGAAGTQTHQITQAELPNVTVSVNPADTNVTVVDNGHSHSQPNHSHGMTHDHVMPDHWHVTGFLNGLWISSTEDGAFAFQDAGGGTETIHRSNVSGGVANGPLNVSSFNGSTENTAPNTNSAKTDISAHVDIGPTSTSSLNGGVAQDALSLMQPYILLNAFIRT